jgi:hypothetical protein
MKKIDGIVLVNLSSNRKKEKWAIYLVAGEASNFKPVTSGISPAELAKLLNIAPLTLCHKGLETIIFLDQKAPIWDEDKDGPIPIQQHLADCFDVTVWYYTKERDEEIKFKQKFTPATEW